MGAAHSRSPLPDAETAELGLAPPAETSALGPHDEPHYATQLANCLCDGIRGRYGVERHCVWLAFLEYDNGEFYEPASCSRGSLLPLNKLATIFGRTQVIHVQLVLWDAVREQFYTFNVNSEYGVYVQSRKAFARYGWRFYELQVSRAQELALHNWCVTQLGKPFSKWGIMLLYFVPYDAGERAWFCSEFCLAALRAAGLARSWSRRGCDVPPHELEEYLEQCFTDVMVIKLGANIVQCHLEQQEERRLAVHGGAGRRPSF